MAMRSQHVYDGSVVERRLRPIYDWLDNGNNKKALQEAEKVLKKSPNLQPAKALKALALVRLGKQHETFAILDALVKEKPSDDTTLQAMTVSFRECYQFDKICNIYESAVKIDPLNEELHTHLFMSYVRVGDYKSQQQAAMTLYKITPKVPYYFWAVMSIVLQAKNQEDETKRNVLLTLAQRMVDKFINENRLEAEQEAKLYIMILEMQGKYNEIITFMNTPLYNKLVPGSLPQVLLPHLRATEQWGRLNVITKELLCGNLDRWDYYLPYLESCFRMSEGNTVSVNENGTEVTVDDTLEKCHEYLSQLIDGLPAGKELRGPYLCRLELYKRLLDSDREHTLPHNMMQLCFDYMRIFGRKPCCVNDLKIYLNTIPHCDRDKMADQLLNFYYSENNPKPDCLEKVQQEVNSICAWRYMGGCKEPNVWCNIMKQRYIDCIANDLSTKIPTEFNAVDMYAILAAHMYYDYGVKSKCSRPILEALNLLEFALKKSPSNFHIKLLCLKFYHFLGNGGAAETIYERLEVKHVQISSLGCWHVARLGAILLPAHARTSQHHAHRFQSHNNNDSVDHLTYSYKYGTLDKLLELMEFRNRLEGCVHCLLCSRDRIILDLMLEYINVSTFYRATPLPHTNLLSDNRDLSVIVDWDPPLTKNPDIAQETFQHEKTYLLLKDIILSALDITIELCEACKKGDDRSKHIDNLDKTVADYDILFAKFAEESCKGLKLWWNVAAPFPSRIIALVNSPVPYRELYVAAFALVTEVAQQHECNSTLDRRHSIVDLLSRSAQQFDKCMEEHRTHSDIMWSNRVILEEMSNYIEFITIMSIIIGVCHNITTPTSIKRNRKKPNHNHSNEQPTHHYLTQVNTELQRCLQTFADQVEHLGEPAVPLDMQISTLMLEDGSKMVEQKLKDGYTDMIIGIRDVIKKKEKYLKGLL